MALQMGIADANNGSSQKLTSHKIITHIMERRRLKLSINNCNHLRINGGKSGVNSLTVYNKPMKVEETLKYLGDTFEGDNVVFCKHRLNKSVRSMIKISLCKETNKQIFSIMVIYHSAFLPRLIYNCESWSNFTHKNLSIL